MSLSVLPRRGPEQRPAVIGMIHVAALPGSPGAKLSLADIIHTALAETSIYTTSGVDALIIENMHDRPYQRGQVGPETVAGMTRVAREVRQAASIPCGVQVLAAANEEALAVALAAELQFVRVEGFVFGHVADEGWIDGCAGSLLRSRAQWRAEGIALWTDLKKKHSSHAITNDVSLAETARAAAYNLSDALIVTGNHTGDPAKPHDLAACQKATPNLPVYIGSGITEANVAQFSQADGFIVGSAFKRDGHWENALDPDRVSRLVDAVRVLP